MADPVLVADRDANIVLCNPTAQRVMNIRVGMGPAQWTHVQEIFMADGVTPVPLEQRPLMRAVRGESFENYEITVRYPHLPKPVTFISTGGPIRLGSQASTGGVVVYHDVTEAREIERQLRQAQKMESVGQLTGGVAHDFNNILTVITGTIEILEEGVADRPELAAIAKMIDDAAERGSQLTRNLLAFSRRQPLQPRKTNVNELVVEAARLLRPTLGENVEIEAMLDDNASLALIDSSQLTTSLLNLAINARDAMPDGGKLTFETADVVLDDSYTAMNPDTRPGPYVMIAVSDNGSGIPGAIIDKVFEPFFTTKAPGKGTGLGLSMVYGFVKQSEGHIKIYSEEGHGTTIKIYLPRATDQAEPLMPTAPTAPIDGGHETILIVEDDAMVRTYVIGASQIAWIPNLLSDQCRGRLGADRQRHADRSPVHRRGHAGGHERTAARGRSPQAPARAESAVHLGLYRERDRASRPARSRRPVAGQALSQAAIGADDPHRARCRAC